MTIPRPHLTKMLRRRRSAAERTRGADVPQLAEAGDFYSPIIDATNLLKPAEAMRIWPAEPADPPGIDMRGSFQLALLKQLSHYRFDPGAARPVPSYDPANAQFPPQDAALLYAMVRLLAPSRVVEVGSGWSTTVTTAAIHDGQLPTRLTCIEPYPSDLLASLGDLIQLRVEKVEHSPPSVFDDLRAGDICFIDSSHVAKTGSDVVHLLLEVLPRLSPGVVVHLHDIFLPEDYPKAWIRSGFNWNEQYLLRALLIGNDSLNVVAFNRWLTLRHPAAVQESLGVARLTGSSAWMATGEATDDLLRRQSAAAKQARTPSAGW